MSSEMKTAVDYVKKYIEEEAYDYNCAESLIHAANEVYGFNLNDRSMKMMAGFGGGVYHEGLCGAISGAVATLSIIYTDTVAHESEILEEVIAHFFGEFKEEFGTINCQKLKEEFRTEKEGCKKIILAAAKILDEIVKTKPNK